MSLRVWLLLALALHVAIGQGGMPDMEETCQDDGGGPSTIGGRGKGGGSPEKPPKQMTLKQARSMMKELRSTLTSDAARKELAAVEGERKARVEKSAGRLDSIAAKVLEKYGFGYGSGTMKDTNDQGGLGEAIRAAMYAGGGHGQHDKKIRMAMEDIEEVIGGAPSKKRLGRVLALDALAGEFVDMKAPAREEALRTVARTAGGELYAEIMAAVQQEGESYVVDQLVEVAKLTGSAAQEHNQDDLRVRGNVLREFARPNDHKVIQARIRAWRVGRGEEL